MDLIKINGVALPTPTVYDFSFSDMDSEKTARNLNMRLLRDRKRARVYGIPLAWDNIRAEEIKRIVLATDPEFFVIAFYDIVFDTYITKEMYAGDRKVNVKIIKADLSDARGSISFNLIER